MWASRQSQERFRFGFTAYAVRLLQDVYFLEWDVDEGTLLLERQELGAIESKKAESALYAPIAGRLRQINRALLADPSTINVDKYGEGWLFEIDGLGGELLAPEQYVAHLDAVWEVTQRTIKGQLNE
jgi:glycine cleavage system H protein